MNKNYVAKVNEEIEKMLEACIILKVQMGEWVPHCHITNEGKSDLHFCGLQVP